MSNTICGVDCSICNMKDSCAGCANTHGQPFGDKCVKAVCCANKGKENCTNCNCILKADLIKEINALQIKNMPEVTDLVSLKGEFVNLEYTLPNGQAVKLLKDNKIYLGYQLEKKNSDRCYGIVADEEYILVCEYGVNGIEPEIIVYKKR